ncbi:hypothetical protein [Shimia biformata]|uniref:hypothetical protein n=1 Tax=Shimia biformata TaxID=1294299 RepID=UPI00194E50D6|nr:hypothetical protein [Shimia biformata]
MALVLRLCAVLVSLSLLGACAVPGKGGASADEIARAAYHHGGQPSLTLYTMISNRSGSGAHTSLLINASQRVAWDPAGSFRADGIVARDDVVYGMTPYMVDFYTRYHARETFHVVVQKLPVSAEVAEMTLRKVQAYGAVAEAHCAMSTSQILSTVPGFEDIKPSYSPLKLMDAFEAKGASFERLYEYDEDDKSKALREFDPSLVKKDS